MESNFRMQELYSARVLNCYNLKKICQDLYYFTVENEKVKNTQLDFNIFTSE